MNAIAFLTRGLLAGLLAGLITFGVANLVGEPSVEAAIAIEEAQAAPEPAAAAEETDHSHDGETAVSRSNQATWGLATATVVFGTALGGLMALASTFAVGRLGRLSAPGTIGTVGVIGFASFYFVPFLKYPPNPPAVGSGDTIGTRTADYFLVVGISVIAAVLAVVAARRLGDRLGTWNAAIAAGLGYLLVVVAATLLLPAHNEVPDTFPAPLLWEFRIASLTVQVTLWATITVILAVLIGRLVNSLQPRVAHRTVATAA